MVRLIAVGLLLSIGMGLLVGTGNTILLLTLIVVMAGAAVIFWRPELGMVFYVFLTITVFDMAALPWIAIPSGRLYVNDLVLVYVLLVVVLRNPGLNWVRTQLALPILIYWLVRVLAKVSNAIMDDEWGGLFSQLGRAELPLLTFFALLGCAKEESATRWLIRGLLVGGIATLFFYLYAAATRNQTLLTYGLLWLRSDVDVSIGQVPRIVALGMPIAYLLLFLAVAQMLGDTPRMVRMASLLLTIVCVMAILVHGFRGYWYATLGAVPIMIVLSLVVQRREKWKGPRVIGIVVVLVLVPFFSSSFLLTSDPVNYLVERVFAPFDLMTTDYSIIGRLEELRWSWPLILSRPILGWGGSAPVNPMLAARGTPWSFIHIGYASHLMTYGFAGLIVFLWLILAYFRYAWDALKHVPDAVARALIVGFVGFTVQTLLVGFTNPGFAETSGVILLNIGFALTIGLAEHARKS